MVDDSSQVIEVDDIIKYLPHRYPFLMVDRVLSYELGDNLTAIKNISVNEPIFTGHFPDNPVMPGVMLVEALAQAGAILAYLTKKASPRDSIFYLASVDNAKFKQIVKPGDQVILKVHIVNQKSSFWKIHGVAEVDGNTACQVDILSAMRKQNT